jgi:YggT family protein
VENLLPNIMVLLLRLCDFYWLILMVSIFGSWFPQLDWYKQPLRFVRDVTDPPLNYARSVIPPLGMFDLSPIAVFLALQVVKAVLQAVLKALV